ncbi:MAG: hypothetical protein H6948_02165 [Zoogloeaceae bacterium]|nr:hypothetical protein [Zoogloeaceae bacterium]
MSLNRFKNKVRRFESGDVLVFVSYWPDGNGYLENGMDSKEPCMVLANKHRGRSMGAAWVIPLSSAHAYVTPQGDPTTYLMKRTADIGNHIGMGDTADARRQVWTAICNYLPELLNAPEFEMVEDERHTRVAVGDVSAYVAGQLKGGAVIYR